MDSQPGPTTSSRSGMGRLIFELILALLVLVGVFWKDITALFEEKPEADAANGKRAVELVRWEYRQATSNESTLAADLKKYGALGWELVAVNPPHPESIRPRRFDREERDPEYKLVFKRPIVPASQSPHEKNIIGTWRLTKTNVDKKDLSDMTFECTDVGKIRVWPQFRGKKKFDRSWDGTYEIVGDSLRITMMGLDPMQDKIKKLTATELIIEDDKGKVEEYQRQ
jgi:uncharacterized protein (TIGR03066 family)